MIYENTKNQSNMKNLKVLFTVLCVACATAVWGESYSTGTIPSGWSTSGGNITMSNIQWAYSSSTYIGLNSSKIQIGSSKKPQTSDWTIQTPISNFGQSIKVTAISITAYTTATTATYDISVNGSSVKSGSLTTSSTSYSVSNLAATSGNIVITLKGSSSSKAMYLSNITVTYESSGSTETTVSFTPSSIDFETVTVGETKTQDVSVTIGNPTSSVNFSVTGSGLSVSPSSLSQNGTVTVTYKPTTAGTLNGTLTASGGGLKTDVTATITGTAQASATTYYTVTWMVGGQKYTEGNPTTSVTGGSKVTTLPDAPADNSLSCAEKFMGWSAQHIGTNPQDDAPADLFTTADASPAIIENTTFYAVFAKPKQSE